ncbi:MAG: GNAT family N-acetyltransferase [Candidatus Paceibacterota bacterium]
MSEKFSKQGEVNKVVLRPEDMVGKFDVDEKRKKDTIRERATDRLIKGLLRGYISYTEENNLEGVDHVRSEHDKGDDYDQDDDLDNNDNVDWEWERKQILSRIPSEVRVLPEVQKAAKEGMLLCLESGNLAEAVDIKDVFSLPTEFIHSVAALNAIKDELIRWDDTDRIVGLVNKFFPNLSPEQALSPELESAFKHVIAQLLSEGYTEKAIEIKSKLSLGAEVISSPEVQNALKKKFSDDLLVGDVREAERLQKHFLLTTEFMHSPEVQAAVKYRVADILSRRDYDFVKNATEVGIKFSLLKENLQEAAKVGMVANLSRGNIHNVIEIRDKFELPKGVSTSPEMQQAAKEGMMSCLDIDNIDALTKRAISIKEEFSVPDEFLASSEVQSAVARIVTYCISGVHYMLDRAVEIRNIFLLSEDLTQEAVKVGMIRQIVRNNLPVAEKMREAFSIPEGIMHTPEVQLEVKGLLIRYLETGSAEQALKLADDPSFSSETLVSPEIQECARKALVRHILGGRIGAYNNGYFRTCELIRDKFALPIDFNTSPEIEEAVKKLTISLLTGAYTTDHSTEVINQFPVVSARVIPSPEVQNAVNARIIDRFAHADTAPIKEYQERFGVSPEAMRRCAREGLLSLLSNGKSSNIRDYDNLVKNFSFTQEELSSQEMQQAVKNGMSKYIEQGNIRLAVEIAQKFFLPAEELNRIAEGELIKFLNIGNRSISIGIKDSCSISKEYISSVPVQQAAKNGVMRQLSKENIEDAVQIKKQFSLTDEIYTQASIEAVASILSGGSFEATMRIKGRLQLSDDAMSQVGKRAFLKCLLDEKKDMAGKIKEKLRVTVNSEDIFGFFPEMRKILSDLAAVSPEFSAQAERTPDLLLSLLEFRNDLGKIIRIARENPFLLDAVAANPRFGSRLLIKYPQFDTIAKSSIKTQFEIKKKIMAEHPDVDPQSVEFRTLMQDSLVGYRLNKQVLESIDAKGINSERWLNYDETAHFNLGSNENTLAFSEIITTPIGRIKETIDTYAHTIKEVLNEYRAELMAFEIVLGKGELPTEELQKMTEALEKARNEGNPKKVAGIEKGIENLKAKFSQERKGVLWEKLLSDVASFQRLKDDVYKAQEIFVATEKELENVVMEKMPSGKRIQEIKRKMASAKEDLRAKFVVMERRIEEFRGNLKTVIAPALGSDRASALIQEINTKLAEQFNHFDTDRSMLKNLFSEQSDKRREEVESRPMSIFVWTRDPDVDLYQGNYSPCCICIDSEYHGAESPISDYNIDLGIQIVNVWDEVRDEPVTAAWCWLGEDEKGEPALVVDNIEANTFYSANFSGQFTNELFKYIKNYAKEIGVKKAILGKANNDLPTAGELSKLPEDAGRYKKIGGASRSDGYFLEAEDTSVKTIWEKGVKLVNRRSEADNPKDAERVIFGEVSTLPLTENDFRLMRDLEGKVYADDSELIQGLELVRDIKDGNGLEYSLATWGVQEGGTKQEMIAYAVAVEGETDEGDKSVYLEDIAVAPEARRRGIGQKLIQELLGKLKVKAARDSKPVLFDMHLRSNSLALLDGQQAQLGGMGVVLLEDVLVPDFYDEGEDAVYRVYEVAAN